MIMTNRGKGVQFAADGRLSECGEWPSPCEKIANLADKEACDTYFTADVFDLHMATADGNHPGLLDEFHTCYVVGDHGSHFSANATLINESTFLEVWQKGVYAFSVLISRLQPL